MNSLSRARMRIYKEKKPMLEFMEPLHPKVVHFPIALFITAFFWKF
jgi:uncharacterized membrane protein